MTLARTNRSHGRDLSLSLQGEMTDGACAERWSVTDSDDPLPPIFDAESTRSLSRVFRAEEAGRSLENPTCASGLLLTLTSHGLRRTSPLPFSTRSTSSMRLRRPSFDHMLSPLEPTRPSLAGSGGRAAPAWRPGLHHRGACPRLPVRFLRRFSRGSFGGLRSAGTVAVGAQRCIPLSARGRSKTADARVRGSVQAVCV